MSSVDICHLESLIPPYSVLTLLYVRDVSLKNSPVIFNELNISLMNEGSFYYCASRQLFLKDVQIS